MASLILLDLSAAFDTIDHGLLLNQLERRFRICGSALAWFKSYLSDRVQSVQIENCRSDPIALNYGVPQGSVLGPILFSLYTSPIGDIVRQHKLDYHLYAHDTQLYVSFQIKNINDKLSRITACSSDINKWMLQNLLKLNDDKTEVLLIGSPHHLRNVSKTTVTICDSTINSAPHVRNLGATFDSSLSIDKFVSQKYQACMLHLGYISRIRKYLSIDACKSVIHALVTSRLDYANLKNLIVI